MAAFLDPSERKLHTTVGSMAIDEDLPPSDPLMALAPFAANEQFLQGSAKVRIRASARLAQRCDQPSYLQVLLWLC
jgi:hypothetical protein